MTINLEQLRSDYKKFRKTNPALVERSHRQDNQEMFSRVDPKDLEQFNLRLEEFWKQRNKRRRLKKLKWMTPDEWLENYVVQAITTVFVINGIEKQK